MVKFAILSNKLSMVVKQTCLLGQNPKYGDSAWMQMLVDCSILIKVYSDCLDSYRALDKTAFISIVDLLLKVADAPKHELSKKVITVASYVIYNLFRYSDNLQIGEDDMICKQAVKTQIFRRVIVLINKAQYFDLSQDAVTTYIEALAAISDTEAFLDYVGEMIPRDFGREFVKFYDSFVIPLLEVPEQRGKMLCFDDVLSWIRRERPEYEQD